MYVNHNAYDGFRLGYIVLRQNDARSGWSNVTTPSRWIISGNETVKQHIRDIIEFRLKFQFL